MFATVPSSNISKLRSRNVLLVLPWINTRYLNLTGLKIFILLCVSTSFYVLWSKYFTVYENLQNNNNPPLKYILLWTKDAYDHDFFREGQQVFMTQNCSFQNCYTSFNREYLDDITKFDAVIFDVRGIRALNLTLPTKRAVHQKYIFFALESADMFPVCSSKFDEYFNWTASYRLDADIFLPYFVIKDVNGTVIGPKQDMQWVTDMSDIDKKIDRRLQNKTKMAAWFVSRCRTNNYRECVVSEVQKILNTADLSVDVYGTCGKFYCARNQHANCTKILQSDYYFYMSMENSFDDDYVTEKLLTAVQNSVVPVVYGGANYSWFLPPGSYLNARLYSPGRLARRMYRLMQSEKRYRKYFRWTRYYSYHDASSSNICSLCSALNNRTGFETYSLRKDFLKWWNRPEKYERCLFCEAKVKNSLQL